MKIPQNANIVHSGPRITVYQWQQLQFDGTYKTFEVAAKRPSVQIFIITCDNKILLSAEEQPYVGKYTNIPGGYIENGETPMETAKKELIEEFGIISDDLILDHVREAGSTVIFQSYVFIARGNRKVSEPSLESGEKVQTIALTFEELIEEIKKPYFRDKHMQAEVLTKSPQELEEMKNVLFANTICLTNSQSYL